jgi:CRISPR/Cas system CSM-associated protein Csm5 (group 7 of RAMP superfamily)
LKPIKEELLCRQWNIHGGLPDPDIFHLPSGVKFVDHPVLVLNSERLLSSDYEPANEKYKEFLWERFYSKRRYGRAKTEPLILQIHDFSSEKKVMAFVKEAFKKHRSEFVIEKPPTLPGASIQGIVLNAIIWNLLSVKITSPTKITRNDAVQIISKSRQSSTQVERARTQFLKFSALSPWCFFTSLK